jgi:hypothetical protein
MTRFHFCNGEDLYVQTTEADIARLVRDGYASLKPVRGARKRVLVLAPNLLYVDDQPPPLETPSGNDETESIAPDAPGKP